MWAIPELGFALPKIPIHLIFIELIPVPGIALNAGDGVASKTLWKKDK